MAQGGQLMHELWKKIQQRGRRLRPAQLIIFAFAALIALGTLLLWGLISYLTFDGKSRVLSQTLAFNAASLLALALVLVQELLLGHYWPNWAGVASQFFFLPLINLTGILPLHYLWLDDVVISLVLFFISLAICRKKQKVIQANEEHP